MASNWSVEITDSFGTLILDSTVKWNLDWNNQVKDNNTIENTDVLITIEGDVRTGTPSDITDRFIEIFEKGTVNLQPKLLVLKQDGTPKFTFSPQTSIVGPFIQLGRSVDEDGNFDSHARFVLTIFVRLRGSAEDAQIIRTSIFTRTVRKEIVLKVWKAFVKAKTAAKALQIALSFKPSEKFIIEEREVSQTESTANLTWIWERREDKKVQLIVEQPVSITGAGRNYTWSPQIDIKGKPKPPKLHVARNEQIVIRIQGRVIGFTKGLIAPQPHFTESATMRRWEAQESLSGLGNVARDPDVPQQWILPYTEVWLFEGDRESIPAPNHHDHLDPKFLKPPPDGKAGS